MAAPRLEGTIAVVTGGGTGLGRALVSALAAGGADVAFSFRESARGAQEAAEGVRASGRRTFSARADARRPGEIASFVERAAAEMGGLDLLVNNVGVFRKVPLSAMTDDVLDEAFAVNVKGAVMASRAAAPSGERPGTDETFMARKERIEVNMASTREDEKPWKTDLARKSALRRENALHEVEEAIKKASSFEDALKQAVEIMKNRFGRYSAITAYVADGEDLAVHTSLERPGGPDRVWSGGGAR